MLPFSWSGRIALPPQAGDNPEQVLDRLETALVEQRASAVQRGLGVITFAGGMFRFVNNWNPLVPISWGRMKVESGFGGLEVHYHITFTETVAFATAGVA